jgi:uncharacterized protein
VADDLAFDPGFLGRGWAFPVVIARDGKVAFAAGELSIEQGLKIVLGTSPGERVMRPEFGCGIWELVMEPNTTQLHGRLQTRVRQALTRWEPRIDVLDVQVASPPEQKNLLLIRINYRVRSNNAAYNLVYPFFLQEGATQ